MASVTFGSITVPVYQAESFGYTIRATESELLSGETHTQLSKNTVPFPKEFLCYTADYSIIESLAAKIGSIETLTVNTESFDYCYISGLDKIKEEIDGEGKYTFRIEFKKSDYYTLY
jgi:hypothetical protein